MHGRETSTIYLQNQHESNFLGSGSRQEIRNYGRRMTAKVGSDSFAKIGGSDLSANALSGMAGLMRPPGELSGARAGYAAGLAALNSAEEKEDRCRGI